MIKILESMKRSYLFFCFVVITVCRIYAADVTYVFADAAVADGIGLEGVWTTDSIDEYSYWQTKKAPYGHSRYVEEGLFIYKNGKFNVYSNRKIKEVILTFDNKAIIQNPNDTILTWNIEAKGTLSKLEITYLTEEQDSIVDTPLGEEYLGIWTQVTDLSQLSIGTKIVIAASSANMALGVVQNLNNRAAVEIEKSANKDTLIINRHVQVISLEKGYNGRNWAFCVADTGYLYAASSKENLMRTQTIVDANASWEISFSNDGVAKIQAMGSNTRRYIKYNVGYNTFSCFETGTVVLYGKDISSISTAINNAEMQVLDMKKAIRNNQVVILRNGLYYNMLGQLVE